MSLRRSTTVVLLLLAAVVGTARAEGEDVDPVKALIEKLDELRKAEDAAGLAEAIATAAEVHNASEDDASKGKLRGELGKILKDKDAGDARLAAVAALVALDDPKEAWKELSKALPGPKTEEATPLDLEVTKAAGTLAQSKAVKSLLELAAKAKDKALAAAAVEALGGFREDKKGRVKILEELIDIGKRTRPGQSTSKNVSTEAQERWNAMNPVLIKALNDLTGKNVPTFEDWEALWNDYKKRPKDLFVD